MNASSQGKSLAADWTLQDFQMKTSTECGYLDEEGPDGLGPLRYVAMYSSWDAAQVRGCHTDCGVP